MAYQNRQRNTKGPGNKKQSAYIEKEKKASLQIKFDENGIDLGLDKKRVEFTSQGQYKAAQTINNSTVSVITGPTGTSKTYLPLAMGIAGVQNDVFKKIVIFRAAVEAKDGVDDDGLGYLSGDLNAKLEPYMKPAMDNIDKIIGKKTREEWVKEGKIEAMSVHHSRGRTIDNAFLFGDEAQNLRKLLRVGVTRIGEGTKVVVSGDIAQDDREDGDIAYLERVGEKFAASKNSALGFFRYSKEDIVRHPLISELNDIFDEVDAEVAAEKQAKKVSAPALRKA